MEITIQGEHFNRVMRIERLSNRGELLKDDSICTYGVVIGRYKLVEINEPDVIATARVFEPRDEAIFTHKYEDDWVTLIAEATEVLGKGSKENRR